MDAGVVVAGGKVTARMLVDAGRVVLGTSVETGNNVACTASSAACVVGTAGNTTPRRRRSCSVADRKRVGGARLRLP